MINLICITLTRVAKVSTATYTVTGIFQLESLQMLMSLYRGDDSFIKV